MTVADLVPIDAIVDETTSALDVLTGEHRCPLDLGGIEQLRREGRELCDAVGPQFEQRLGPRCRVDLG